MKNLNYLANIGDSVIKDGTSENNLNHIGKIVCIENWGKGKLHTVYTVKYRDFEEHVTDLYIKKFKV
jgi:hypothetical protein